MDSALNKNVAASQFRELYRATFAVAAMKRRAAWVAQKNPTTSGSSSNSNGLRKTGFLSSMSLVKTRARTVIINV